MHSCHMCDWGQFHASSLGWRFSLCKTLGARVSWFCGFLMVSLTPSISHNPPLFHRVLQGLPKVWLWVSASFKCFFQVIQTQLISFDDQILSNELFTEVNSRVLSRLCAHTYVRACAWICLYIRSKTVLKTKFYSLITRWIKRSLTN